MSVNKTFLVVLLSVLTCSVALTSPKGDFMDYVLKAETDPMVVYHAKDLAILNNLPLEILFKGTPDFKVSVVGVEETKVVYAVYYNLLHPLQNGELMFYEDVQTRFDLSSAKIIYRDHVVDNTNGYFDPVFSSRGSSGKLLMITEWDQDKVIALDAETGDVVNLNFIPSSFPILQSPRDAKQSPWGTILVADQISDAVQEFDTTGTYIRIYAPSTGVNPNILDNIRSLTFKRNSPIIYVSVASSANQNTFQEFDTGGVHVGPFINTNIASPFDLKYWKTVMIASASSGSQKMSIFDTTGTFIAYGPYTSSFLQQMYITPNDSVAVSSFSGAGAGLAILDSNGALLTLLNAVTGNRGVNRLPNGNWIVTNSGGVHEITPENTLVRTIVTGGNHQYVNIYDPDFLVGTGPNISTNLPEEYSLSQNFPNPFNPSTRIKFSIPENEFVSLKVYDATGKEVATITEGFRQAGTYDVSFNGIGLASGIYLYTLTAGNFSQTNRMILVK